MNARRVSEELRLAAANPASPLIPPVPEWDTCWHCSTPKPDVTLRVFAGKEPFHACEACAPPDAPRYSPPPRRAPWRRNR